MIEELKERVLAGEQINRAEALRLAEAPLKELTEAADEIRTRFCGRTFDLCTIINGKCGRCSEDCKYCAQSVHYQTACTGGHMSSCQRKSLWSRRNITRNRASFAIPL